MSHSIKPVPLTNTPYDPLPLESEQHRLSDFHDSSPSLGHLDLPPEGMAAGGSRPRFLGAMQGDNSYRQSIASSQNLYPSGASDYSSVYGLNQGYNTVSSTGSTPHLGSYRDDPAQSSFDITKAEFTDSNRRSAYLSKKRDLYASPNSSKRRLIIIAGIVGLVLLAIIIGVGVYFGAVKKNSSKNDSANPSSSASSAPSASAGSGGNSVRVAVTGGDGSTVTKDDGSTFTYKNSFGGYWYWDETDPFNNGAKAQSWSPALNETFNYGVDRIWGVNLGGWLNTEPFIVPALYQKYLNASPVAVDEWTLSEAMIADTSSGGGISQLENHYATFITEEDFAEIAAAGLNFVRIPLPYWAIETRENEPFLAKTCWKYFLKAVQWARKYGIRINLDLHALPGSQNGWNHSGRLGTINMLYGPMGYANAQRSLDYIRILAEFISQPEYKDVVVMFGITNEPRGSPIIGQDVLSSYYFQAYKNVRLASGVGAGKGPYVSLHDGFFGLPNWSGFMPNADRLSVDLHPYLCFADQSSAPLQSFATAPCQQWASAMNDSMTNFGLSTAGEFSLATNDCGLFVNGVNLGTRYEGTYTPGTWPAIGSCAPWTDWTTWDDAQKQAYKQIALASMDALQNWFFWTWKIGNSTKGVVEAPQWSYQLGLQQGWMPTDPRQAAGTCGNTDPWSGALQSWQTGGAGADQIPASVSSALAWPPATMSNAGPVSLLPSYTQTAPLVTLPAATFTATSGKSTSTIVGGDGWENSADTQGMATEIPGCSYLDPWVGDAAPPAVCTVGAGAKRSAIPESRITEPPSRR